MLSLTVYAQSRNIEWDRDLDFLAKELSEKHCDFFTIRSKSDLLAGIEAIKSESKQSPDFHTALKTQQLIATLGDSHTSLNFTNLLNLDQILPMQLFWTSDGLHVLRTTSGHKELLGRRVEAINDSSVAVIADSLSTLITVDNRAIVKKIVPQFISCLQILHYFGFTDTEQAELTLDGGEKHTLKAKRPEPADIVTFQADSLCFADRNSKVFFTQRYFPNEKIYYLLYNKCWSREVESKVGSPEKATKMPSFEEFAQQAFETLKTKPVEKIIFDMRYNGGGNSAQGTQFIKQLAGLLKENPHMSVYVVIGRKTFSSAILNVMDFKRLTNAILVGEETSGKPNHFGEIRSIQLPSSGLNVGYSTKYFKRSDENLTTLTPDVTIEASFQDFTKGIDPVYEWIKRQTPANRSN